MKNDQFIQPDDAFKKGLHNMEVPFEDAAWESMEQLLDKDEKRAGFFLIPSGQNYKKFNLKNILIVMSILTILTISSALFCNRLATEPSAQRSVVAANTTTITAPNHAAKDNAIDAKWLDGETQTNLKSTDVAIGGSVGTTYNQFTATPSNLGKSGSKSTPATSYGTTSKENQDAVDGGGQKETEPAGKVAKAETTPKDSVKAENPHKTFYTKQYVVRNYWVDDEYEYFNTPKHGPIKDFWMGVHFTRQQDWGLQKDSITGLNKFPWPSQVQSGFNLQFMSGTLAKQKHFAAYWGGDWGMQFYGRTKNSTVIYNTASSDTGFTRLNSLSADLLLKGHFEYTIGRFSPYINISAGPRIYGTSQYISAYFSMGDSTGEDRHNVKASASFMAGVGIGARFRMNDWASVDMRYEWMRGTPVSVVDMRNSKFNNLSYDLATQTITPQSQQFKFGIIFDLSPAKRTKKLVREGHYVQEVFDSVKVDENDTLIRYLPCDCKPCDKVKRNYEDTEDDDIIVSPSNRERDVRQDRGSRTTNPSGPVNTGTPKGKVFPGVKAPKTKF